MASPRWHGAIAVLTEMRRSPGVTRAAVAQRLGLSSGSATDITARLRELALLTETPAPAAGRGRPTTVLGPHPEGPVVIAVDLRHEDWRCAVAGVDGRPEVVAAAPHASRDPDQVLEAVGGAVRRTRERLGDRVRAVAVAVAATVQHGRVVQGASLGWGPVDLTPLGVPGVGLRIDNDATLAGVAEARAGAGAGAGTALHVTVEVGVGGTLVVDGRPVRGATGAGGEFGHLPFGDPALRCPCGALGCWDPTVDGRALARHLGDPPPPDPRTYALAVLGRTDPAATAAVSRAAESLGRGIAGLVNGLDPEVVTLGGLAEPLRAAAPDAFAEAFTGGLMAFRRATPPPLRPAALGDDAALHGAAATALDAVLTEESLTAWARLRGA
ncbi:MAG TPA: ROK family transcriptional regulator [Pseudonocardia sp.]|jgi:predicted NBD/HSP70 family sugar kinase|uniref:ROK family transcriptional regulator n=1 Tax=Pseudonocardia sp. TaxID=60912 RepID=UPI002B4B9542|nr:ROK family transcriptional regulator [Pseudonocardia sp.]HLU55086.1 ROK family transcriptional regulator [Pseudonocardia sp.]